jgi:hypothetical protein
MATFVWIPSKDKDFEWFALGQCQNNGFKYLKRSGQIFGRDDLLKKYVAEWKTVKTGDHVMIGGHGFATSSQKIAWIGKYPHDDVVSWTFDELAKAIGGLTVTNAIASLDFTLCMCWGADATIDEAFAGKFASALKKYNVTGTVTAFPGKMVIDGFSGQIVINGTSRITSAANKYKGAPAKLAEAVAGGKVAGHQLGQNVALTFPIPKGK